MHDMRALITGASGLVASHLARALGEVTAFTHRDLDITDRQAVHDAVRQHNPQVLFNCAVIGVDHCEDDPSLAERVNVDGPRNLARAANDIGATIVHFSTNYVFDGEANIPYAPQDAAHPVNVYGETKLRGEHAVIAANQRSFIIRTSWVFGAGRESFLSTAAARLTQMERIQAITDTFASVTFVEDLISRTIHLVHAHHFGTHHIVNEGICSYETFAREAARLVGADDALIELRTEGSMGRKARRPRWTPMQSTVPMRTWQEALAEFVRR